MNATLRDIAKAVGVDISTVSKVLQGAPIRVSAPKRAEILRVAGELNYRPNTLARSLRLRRSGAIAMPMPSTTNYVFPEIINGAEEAADRLGFVLFVLKQSANSPVSRLLTLIEEGRVDGLLFAEQPNDLAALVREGVPYISLNRLQDERARYVALDDESGFACQATFLAARGHRTCAFIRVSPSSFVSKLCERSFLDSWTSEGGSCPASHRMSCDFGGIQCLDLVDQILRLERRPTAVATASVVVASRLVEGFRGRGVRVPEDISVIGYHDSPVAQWPPPGVTTVQMPSREQGYRAVEALVQLIEGKAFESEILKLPPRTIDRGTVADVSVHAA